MISEATIKTLEMLRRAPKAIPAPVPMKRPTGGRPNPCLGAKETESGWVDSKLWKRSRKAKG